MLDTLLEIGAVLRESKEGLKHHRYVKPAPLPSKDNPVQYWAVRVNEDGSFDFGQRELLEGESQYKGLFYLNFKTSDADSLKKYLMGDVYRTITKTGEDGNFRLGDPGSGAAAFRVNSFLRGEADATLFKSEHLDNFRRSFRTQIEAITDFLRAERNVYLHFDYEGQPWHKLPEFEVLNTQLLSSFFAATSDSHYVIDAALHKTLSGKVHWMPDFGSRNAHKVAQFSRDQALNLIYAIDCSRTAVARAHDLSIVVLPRGDRIEASDIERFFLHQSSIEDGGIETKEGQISAQNTGPTFESDAADELFKFLFGEDCSKSFTQFDCIFCKKEGKVTIDAVEVAGLDRSKLSHIATQIRKMRAEIEEMREREMPPSKKGYRSLSVAGSLKSLVGDMTTAKKKYQSHLFQVLPQIYTGTYFRDPILLPALIEKSEFHLREGNEFFPFLRYDFLFLTRIQIEGDKYLMDIKESQSYKIGLLLGKLARPLRTRINSFDKNYAGLLSRRIGSKADLVALVNELNQKLIMHDCIGFTYATSRAIALELKDFTGRYDKDECAFGFFESYYAPIPKKETATTDAADSDEAPQVLVGSMEEN